ncbi:MAG: ribosome small subunit-dependent GTPase A [Bacteroidales bacterium]
MEGTVVKSTGSWYLVMDDQGNKIECRLRGRFKISGSKSTNPLAVGDRVSFHMDPDQPSGIIDQIHPRRNYIIRKATNLSRRTHVIAANLDQAMIIVTLAVPRTSTGFLDRFLVTCEAYSIPAIIVFNKIDLYPPELLQYLDELMGMYQGLGYTCLKVSAITHENLDAFQEALTNRTTLLSGHSGVGKSTLINAIDPRLNIKVQDISRTHQKGKHTTTFAEMHPLKQGGSIIDTPGIKEFGLVDFDPEELSHFFPEMRLLFNQCRFDNCTHMNEPGCKVKEEVEKGNISISRYNNYINMLLGEDSRT